MKFSKVVSILAAFVLSYYITSAQIVVSDPAGLTQSIVNSSDQIAQQAATTEQVLRTFEQTREICIQQRKFFETLKKVSSSVRSIERIERIMKDVSAITEMYSISFPKISSSPLYTVSEVASVADSYARLMMQAGDELLALKRILADDAFSMSDADRIIAVDHIAENAHRIRVLTSYFTSRTLSVASVRRFLAHDAERMYGYMTK